MQEIAGKVWKKEEELKQLKSELAALDRKIQLELAPPAPEAGGVDNKQAGGNTLDTSSIDTKKSMVDEPIPDSKQNSVAYKEILANFNRPSQIDRFHRKVNL